MSSRREPWTVYLLDDHSIDSKVGELMNLPIQSLEQ